MKANLEIARTNTAQSRQTPLTANAKLDMIQPKISKVVVSFAFGSTVFVLHQEVAEKIVACAKLAWPVNITDYADSVGTPASLVDREP